MPPVPPVRDLAALADAQALFAVRLLDPQNDAPSGLFRGDPGLAERRFALYRGNLTAHWDKALAEAYPTLQALVGEAFFAALARAYGRARPSVSGDLNLFGADFAEFLAGFAHTTDYPYFPDVARLEWALHRAHCAADVVPLDAARLASLAPQALDDLVLALRPACCLIASEWATVALWKAHQPPPAGQPFPQPLQRRTVALVHRPYWRAQIRELAAGEYAALQALAAGATLGAALETACERQAEFDPAAALEGWLTDRLFAALPDPDQQP